MNEYYKDIIEKIPEKPTWFDEHAVPRYCQFSPREIANIYADECALVLIACQSCKTEFKVALSHDKMDNVRYRMMFDRDCPSLANEIGDRTIHYGDPPNIECCPTGPTMNSVPIKVLQYWERWNIFEWKRHKELEIEVKPDWAKGL